MLKNIFFIFISMCLFSLFGCEQQSNNQQKLNNIIHKNSQVQNEFAKTVPKNAPVLKVATEALLIPFEFRDEKRNTIIGYDVDLINAIASTQGMQVKILDRPWNGILDDLRKNEYDLVIGAIGITPEKKEKYEFSHAYSPAPNAMAVLANSTITNVRDLKNKSIGILAGGESYFNQSLQKLGTTDFKITEYKTLYLALKDLIAKKIDVIVGDKAILSYHINNLKQYNIKIITLPSNGSDTNIYFVAKKGNIDLINKINHGLDTIKNNGVYHQINKKWFGENSNE